MENRHEGKMPHKFNYTYNDISSLTGLSLWTIRSYVSKKKFNPDDLWSVCQFIMQYKKPIYT